VTIGKRNLTILVNVFFAFIASVIAFFTDWLILIPVLFAIGIPLVNLEKPFSRKVLHTGALVLASVMVFIMAVLASLNIDYQRYVMQGIVSGVAGVLMLITNGIFVNTISVTWKSALLTFVLAGISFPLWFLAEHSLPKTIMNIDIIPEFGQIMFWITLTTIGIASGIREKRRVRHTS
jgi:hypothetical protein